MHMFKAQLIALSLLSACASAPAAPGEAEPITALSLTESWSLGGFSMPESVYAAPDSPWLYVSNVNGPDTGFISRVKKDGTGLQLRWVEGIQNPTGMARFAGKLYVVNSSEVVVVDLARAQIEARVAADAKLLNDITVTEDGRFFVGDLLGGGIYSFSAGDARASLWLHAPELSTPNGIVARGDKLFVGTVGTRLARDLKPDEFGSLYEISLKDKTLRALPAAEKLGSLDGLAPFAGGWLTTASVPRATLSGTRRSRSLSPRPE